jgi:hypothetical protein
VTEPLNPGTLELLTWVADRPRTYADAIEAWRSNCPRLSAWDDALTAGLLQVVRNRVTLTARGRVLLDDQAASSRAASAKAAV